MVGIYIFCIKLNYSLSYCTEIDKLVESNVKVAVPIASQIAEKNFFGSSLTLKVYERKKSVFNLPDWTGWRAFTAV